MACMFGCTLTLFSTPLTGYYYSLLNNKSFVKSAARLLEPIVRAVDKNTGEAVVSEHWKHFQGDRQFAALCQSRVSQINNVQSLQTTLLHAF